MTNIIDLDKSREFVAELERDPDRVQLYHGELEKLIASCMEEVHQLAKQGETQRKIMDRKNICEGHIAGWIWRESIG